MNTTYKLALPLTVAFILSACGGSGSSTTPAPTATVNPPTTTTPTAPTTPEAVHHIDPSDVAEYVENFKLQYDALDLQIDGVSYDLSFLEEKRKDNHIYATYEKGFVIIGFNFKEGEPISELLVLETELDNVDEAFADTNAYLVGNDITIEFDDDNAIYSGTLSHLTKGSFPIRMVLNESLTQAGSTQVNVDGTTATITGEAGTLTYVQISDVISNRPEVDTLLLQHVPGSVNDDINMHTGRLIRNAQLTTKVAENSVIASGGVDLFAAGFNRIYTDGAFVGVHSWATSDGVEASKLDKNDALHGAQLTYFREMLGESLGPEFYFFTLNAAPFESIHQMTLAELEKYLLIM